MTDIIPLVEYWRSKVGDEPGDFGEPPNDPAAYAEWKRGSEVASRPQVDKEKKVWAEICAEAASGRIKVKAFRHVAKATDRSWYPKYADSNLREDVPADFFAIPDKIKFGPMDPVVFYWADLEKGGPQNAPWSDPLVIIQGQTSDVDDQSTRSAQRETIALAVREIWQGKVPAGLIVKRRNAEIQDFAKKNSLAWPSDRTIRRYFNA
jgi:hypothetical protein